MKFPSYAIAILFGTIGMPIFIIVMNYINKSFDNQLLLFGWTIVGFVLPLLLSTANIGYIRSEFKNGRFLLKSWFKAEDFRYFYFPTWKRMGAWFASSVISVLLFKALGVIS